MYDLHSIENMNELAFIEGEKRRKEAEAARNKMKLSTWDWDVLTDKGNFHFAVVGRWRQNEALLRLKRVIHWLKLEVNEYVDGTHYKVPETNQCTILEIPKPSLVWDTNCGRPMGSGN